MGSKAGGIAGTGNQAIGKAKTEIGKIVGSAKTHIDAIAQDVKGGAHTALNAAKETIKDTANRLADEANRRL